MPAVKLRDKPIWGKFGRMTMWQNIMIYCVTGSVKNKVSLSLMYTMHDIIVCKCENKRRSNTVKSKQWDIIIIRKVWHAGSYHLTQILHCGLRDVDELLLSPDPDIALWVAWCRWTAFGSYSLPSSLYTSYTYLYEQSSFIHLIKLCPWILPFPIPDPAMDLF